MKLASIFFTANESIFQFCSSALVSFLKSHPILRIVATKMFILQFKLLIYGNFICSAHSSGKS